MARKVGVFASQGMRPGAADPPWIYRAVAYEAEDTFRQPVWTCAHDHTNSADAQSCGAEWLASQTDVEDAET